MADNIQVEYETCGPEKAWDFVMRGTDAGAPVFFLGLKLEPGQDLKSVLLFAAKAFVDLQQRVAAQDADAAPAEVPWPQDDIRAPRESAPTGLRLEVVGESHYLAAFEAITGGRTYDGFRDFPVEAVLSSEPGNRYDQNAIVVKVAGRTVGYMARDVAKEMQPFILDCERRRVPVACRAFINGGWDRDDGDTGDFGISIDLDSLDGIMNL